MKCRILVFVVLLCACICNADEKIAGEIYIVSAAGYKLPVSKVVDMYEKESGQKVNAVYGNMKVITTYVEQSGSVSLIIGDSRFINKSGIKLSESKKIGDGKLVVVYQNNLKIRSIDDLLNDEVKRIGIPDPKKAIYGRAAVELFQNAGIYEKIKDKLIILKTVPQVSSYLRSGDIDVGVINITDYVKMKDWKVSEFEVSQDMYNKIIIQAGLISNEAKELFEFMNTKQAREIFDEYGL